MHFPFYDLALADTDVIELDLPQVVLSFLSDEVGETSDEVAR